MIILVLLFIYIAWNLMYSNALSHIYYIAKGLFYIVRTLFLKIQVFRFRIFSPFIIYGYYMKILICNHIHEIIIYTESKLWMLSCIFECFKISFYYLWI